MDVDDWGLGEIQASSSAPAAGSFNDGNVTSESQLDLVFILDCTGSMGSYITSATKNIELIVENIVQSPKLSHPDSLRIGLIAYRDHPPQDNSYITKQFPFSSDPSEVKTHLKTLWASGGGDGPEAVTAALKAALDLEWREGASKMTVLIADAPPHGLGEYGDGFSESPDGEDPLDLARRMANAGIACFVVACEPALSGYLYGNDFFRALSIITSAVMLPLTSAALLSRVIVGSALEHMDMERLIKEVGQAVSERVHSGQQSVDDVAAELYEKLKLRNEATTQLEVENIYRDLPEAQHNVEVLVGSQTLHQARGNLKKISASRFTDKYNATRYGRSRSYGSYASAAPPVPERPTPPTPSSPGRSRAIVSDFKAFAAPATMSSMAETPLREPVKVVDDTAMDELAQSVELKLGAISLDQAKRITLASAWRSAPPRA